MCYKPIENRKWLKHHILRYRIDYGDCSVRLDCVYDLAVNYVIIGLVVTIGKHTGFQLGD